MSAEYSEQHLSDVETVYQGVCEKILDGSLPAGTRLPEVQLAREYGVSRTPVRLAIERLVAEGQAQHLRNRGAVVRRLSREEICGLLAIRQLNESLAARWASERVTPEDGARMEAVLSQMEQVLSAGDLDAYYALSGQLHQDIMRLCGNDFLVDIINKIYRITYRSHIAVLVQPGRAAESLREHRRLVEAILSKDGERAHRAMWIHLGRICEEYAQSTR